MATPNIVPRADSEGGLGTASKYWASAYIDTITTTSHINLPDNAKLRLGTGNDMSIDFDGTNGQILQTAGDLYITNSANDKDIIFQSDDGSGGVETYFTIDGSVRKTEFARHTSHKDNIAAYFGDGLDLQIFLILGIS